MTTRPLGGDTMLVSLVTISRGYSPEYTSQAASGERVSEPMRISVRVFVRDTSESVMRAQPLALAACPVTLRLYRAANRSGAPVWQSDAAPSALACPTTVQLSPSDYAFEWDVPTILGDSLTAGRYAVTHAVHLGDGRTLEYATGGAYLSATPELPTRDWSAVRMTARTALVGQGPRRLQATVVVANTGVRPVEANYGACTTRLRLFRGRTRIDAPVWRSEFSRPPDIDGERTFSGCPAIGYSSVVAPGDSLVFRTAFPLSEVLADSLPDGVYAVTAELSIGGADLPVGSRAGAYLLDAGAVELVRAPDPLPSSRLVDGLTFVATTRLIAGATSGADTVRTLVLVRNDGATRVDAGVSRNCPVIVYAYRAAAVRDSVPIQRPAWSSLGCELVPHRFALEPGKAWVFSHDVPVADVVATAGPGRYWFAAWFPGQPAVVLAAGDVELKR